MAALRILSVSRADSHLLPPGTEPAHRQATGPTHTSRRRGGHAPPMGTAGAGDSDHREDRAVAMAVNEARSMRALRAVPWPLAPWAALTGGETEAQTAVGQLVKGRGTQTPAGTCAHRWARPWVPESGTSPWATGVPTRCPSPARSPPQRGAWGRRAVSTSKWLSEPLPAGPGPLTGQVGAGTGGRRREPQARVLAGGGRPWGWDCSCDLVRKESSQDTGWREGDQPRSGGRPAVTCSSIDSCFSAPNYFLSP